MLPGSVVVDRLPKFILLYLNSSAFGRFFAIFNHCQVHTAKTAMGKIALGMGLLYTST